MGFLVISPHIDDEALGCGGILDERFHVHYCGVEDRPGVPRSDRLDEARACADRLGFTFSVDPDNTVNEYRVPELIGQLETVVREARPHTVLAPYPSYNQDHRAVLEAVLVAVRPHDINHFVSNLLLYEQVQVGIWPHAGQLLRGQSFHPQLWIPIDIERKLAAYRCHRSQVRAMRSEELVRTLARWRGAQAGCEHAEAFGVVRLCDPTILTLGTLSDGS